MQLNEAMAIWATPGSSFWRTLTAAKLLVIDLGLPAPGRKPAASFRRELPDLLGAPAAGLAEATRPVPELIGDDVDAEIGVVDRQRLFRTGR